MEVTVGRAKFKWKSLRHSEKWCVHGEKEKRKKWDMDNRFDMEFPMRAMVPQKRMTKRKRRDKEKKIRGGG